MKRVAFLVSVGLVIVLLVSQSQWVGSLFSRTTATVSVQETTIPLALYIDNQLSGTLPLPKQSLSPGVHTFSLRNLASNAGPQMYWNGDLEVNPGDMVVISVIAPTQERIDGIVLTRFFPQSDSGTYSRVFVKEDARISINGNEYQNSPIVITDNAIQDFSIQTLHEVYPSIQFSFTKDPQQSFSTHVYLLYDPIAETTYIKNIADKKESIGMQIHRWWEWSSKRNPLPKENFKESSWSTIDVYAAVLPDVEIIQQSLLELEERFTDLAYSPRIPFCFIVDPKGNVWEGFGVWNTDFSQFTALPWNISSGSCPVLQLQQENEHVYFDEVYMQLQHFISQPAQHAAEVPERFNQIVLKDLELATVDVNVKNIGWSTWHPQDTDEVAIVSSGPHRSEMYDQDDWLEPKKPNRSTDPVVIPGGEIIIALPLRAPMYSLNNTELFEIAVNNVVLADTLFSIPIKVEGIGKAVSVINPPNGFLNVYESDTEGSKLIASLFEGEKIAFLDQKGAWVKVRLRDGREGWAMYSYIHGL